MVRLLNYKVIHNKKVIIPLFMVVVWIMATSTLYAKIHYDKIINIHLKKGDNPITRFDVNHSPMQIKFILHPPSGYKIHKSSAGTDYGAIHSIDGSVSEYRLAVYRTSGSVVASFDGELVKIGHGHGKPHYVPFNKKVKNIAHIKVSVSSDCVCKGKKVQFTATLLRDDGSVDSGHPVTVYFRPGGSVTTSSGHATYTYTADTTGTISVAASANGYESMGQPATFKVGDPNTATPPKDASTSWNEYSWPTQEEDEDAYLVPGTPYDVLHKPVALYSKVFWKEKYSLTDHSDTGCGQKLKMSLEAGGWSVGGNVSVGIPGFSVGVSATYSPPSKIFKLFDQPKQDCMRYLYKIFGRYVKREKIQVWGITKTILKKHLTGTVVSVTVEHPNKTKQASTLSKVADYIGTYSQMFCCSS